MKTPQIAALPGMSPLGVPDDTRAAADAARARQDAARAAALARAAIAKATGDA